MPYRKTVEVAYSLWTGNIQYKPSLAAATSVCRLCYVLRKLPTLRKVDFPAPFGPTTPTTVLESKLMLTFSNSRRWSGSLEVTLWSSITLSPRVTPALLSHARGGIIA